MRFRHSVFLILLNKNRLGIDHASEQLNNIMTYHRKRKRETFEACFGICLSNARSLGHLQSAYRFRIHVYWERYSTRVRQGRGALSSAKNQRRKNPTKHQDLQPCKTLQQFPRSLETSLTQTHESGHSR